ncbi:hypothetical protein Nepgr_001594 [Nepenthes gracilis]|uniref:Uncharacterized protein n=1 Tax=Nepenthes gracilis TaxID=150966 RepID=A0AAD3P6A9_NEPGR|nr:hypothetical protein Nepgr_001594 [Nepenthes gracilis]
MYLSVYLKGTVDSSPKESGELPKIDGQVHLKKSGLARLTECVFALSGVGTTRRLNTIIDESPRTPDRTG